MSPVEDRNWWKWRRDELTWAICIINPAGTEYEISESRLAQLDRDVATLLNDMLEGLIDIQNENEALRARDALRDKAEGQVAFDVVAQLEAAKAERAADKAGFEAVIRELRGEVAALKADRAEREKQEPVAWCTSSPTPNVPGQLKIPLYAAPPVIARIDVEGSEGRCEMKNDANLTPAEAAKMLQDSGAYRPRGPWEEQSFADKRRAEEEQERAKREAELRELEKQAGPCPFCGGRAKRLFESLGDRCAYAHEVTYRCTSCGASVSACGDSSKGGYADNSTVEQRALGAWNKRARRAK